MSDFMTALVDLLPEHSKLKDTRNPLRKVLDLTVGEWFDDRDVQDFYEQLFLQSATGEWLNLHGRDYGVVRQLGESDEDYRERIVYERLGHLTTKYLIDVYGLSLFKNINNFNPKNNVLTSDNEYLHDGFMADADEQTKNILNKKFVLGSGLRWL